MKKSTLAPILLAGTLALGGADTASAESLHTAKPAVTNPINHEDAKSHDKNTDKKTTFKVTHAELVAQLKILQDRGDLVKNANLNKVATEILNKMTPEQHKQLAKAKTKGNWSEKVRGILMIIGITAGAVFYGAVVLCAVCD